MSELDFHTRRVADADVALNRFKHKNDKTIGDYMAAELLIEQGIESRKCLEWTYTKELCSLVLIKAAINNFRNCKDFDNE